MSDGVPLNSEPRVSKPDPAYPQFGVRAMVEAGHKALAYDRECEGFCIGNNMHARQVALRVLEALGIEPEEATHESK